MNAWFATAGAASAATMLVHLFVGGHYIARPLLASRDMHPVAKYTNYYCWHMVSIVLLAMTAAFAHSARAGSHADLAVAATALAVAFCLWNIGLLTWQRQSPVQMPQWALFAVIAALGMGGLR